MIYRRGTITLIDLRIIAPICRSIDATQSSSNGADWSQSIYLTAIDWCRRHRSIFHGQSKFQGTKYHSNIWQPLQNRRSLWHQRSIVGSTSMLNRRWWTIDRHLMNDRSSPSIDCRQPLIDADECSIVGDDPTIDRCRWTIIANDRLCCLWSIVVSRLSTWMNVRLLVMIQRSIGADERSSPTIDCVSTL